MGESGRVEGTEQPNWVLYNRAVGASLKALLDAFYMQDPVLIRAASDAFAALGQPRL